MSAGAAENCKKCGRTNSVWFAPSPLWNAVIRGGSIDGEPKFGDMVCASCFIELAEEQGIASRFRVYAVDVHVELETVTPSGRVWNDERGLWDQPQAKPSRDDLIRVATTQGMAPERAEVMADRVLARLDALTPQSFWDAVGGRELWRKSRRLEMEGKANG